MSPGLVRAAALGIAALSGALLARNVGLGLGLVGACGFVALVLLDLPLAIAAWVPLAWIEYSHLTGRAPVIAIALLVVAWLGTRRMTRSAFLPADGDRSAMVALGALLVWLTLSIAWASDRSAAWSELKSWYAAAAAFLVVVTAMATARNARLLCIAFALGAVVSIVVGLSGHGGLTTTANAIDLATQQRFSGGEGDPNYLAAGLVAAIALAAGAIAATRDPVAKLGLGAAIGASAAALAATESRGGIIAAMVALIAAVVLLRGRRAYAAALGVVVVAAVGAFLLASPGGLHRVTHFNAGGNGRAELWSVAWRMTDRHPIGGVGIAGFETHAKDFVRRPGGMRFVRLIVDEPHVAHNIYLQQLAETGVVGLLLLLAVIWACLVAAARAAPRFDAAGDRGFATLARASLVAMIGFLAASFFISDGADKRLWLVLALGPTLQATAARRLAAATAPAHAAPSSTER